MLESEAYCPEIKLPAPKGRYSRLTHLSNLKGSPLSCLFSVDTAAKYSSEERRRPLYSIFSFKMERSSTQLLAKPPATFQQQVWMENRGDK